MRWGLIALGLTCTACASYQGVNLTGQVPLTRWSGLYPRASTDLGAWASKRPGEATWLFTWLGEHPERAREWIRWARTSAESVTTYLQGHPQADGLEAFAPSHREPIDEFLAWSRHFPDASEQLLSHSKSLAWNSAHLDLAVWHLEHPGD